MAGDNFRQEIERWGLRLDVVSVRPGWRLGHDGQLYWQRRIEGHYPPRAGSLAEKVVVRG